MSWQVCFLIKTKTVVPDSVVKNLFNMNVTSYLVTVTKNVAGIARNDIPKIILRGFGSQKMPRGGRHFGILNQQLA